MKRKTFLRICYWCLLVIAGCLSAIVFPKWTLKDIIIPIIIMVCCIGAGYIDRIVDEIKED